MERKTQFAASPGGGGHAGHDGPHGPSPWVARFLAGVASGGQVLDVACGGGRHLRLAVAHGHAVTGLDRDLSRVGDLAAISGVELVEADLERGASFPLAGRRFAGVIVTNYLWRPILPDVVAAVASDGMLIYETFGAGNERHGKPSNPAFLLRPGELIEAVRGRLTPVAYEHAAIDGPPVRIVQRIVAVGPEHRWLTEPPAAWPGRARP